MQLVRPTDKEVRRFGGGGAAGGILRRKPTAAPGFVPPVFASLQLWYTVEVPASINHTGVTLNTWTDQSANAYTGTSSGSTTYIAGGGPAGYDSIRFTPNSRVDAPSTANLNPSGTITLLWAGRLYTASGSLFGKTGTYFDGWGLDFSGGQVYGFVNAYNLPSTRFVPTLNTWIAIAYRYDSVNQSIWNSSTKLADTPTAGAIITNVVPVSLGAMASFYSNSDTVEAAMYNTALSDADINTWLAHFTADYGTP